MGWASLRGFVHKCVANVGFSPTFVDAQNREKTVEAHLLHSFEDDFYDEPLALVLLAFLRLQVMLLADRPKLAPPSMLRMRLNTLATITRAPPWQARTQVRLA